MISNRIDKELLSESQVSNMIDEKVSITKGQFINKE